MWPYLHWKGVCLRGEVEGGGRLNKGIGEHVRMNVFFFSFLLLWSIFQCIWSSVSDRKDVGVLSLTYDLRCPVTCGISNVSSAVLQAAVWRGWRAQRGGARCCTQRGAGLVSLDLHPLYVQHETSRGGQAALPLSCACHPRRHHGGQVSIWHTKVCTLW